MTFTAEEIEQAEKQLVERLPELAKSYDFKTLDPDEACTVVATVIQCELNRARMNWIKCIDQLPPTLPDPNDENGGHASRMCYLWPVGVGRYWTDPETNEGVWWGSDGVNDLEFLHPTHWMYAEEPK